MIPRSAEAAKPAANAIAGGGPGRQHRRCALASLERMRSVLRISRLVGCDATLCGRRAYLSREPTKISRLVQFAHLWRMLRKPW